MVKSGHADPAPGLSGIGEKSPALVTRYSYFAEKSLIEDVFQSVVWKLIL